MTSAIDTVMRLKRGPIDKRGMRVTPGMPHWSEESNAKKPTLLAVPPKSKKALRLDAAQPVQRCRVKPTIYPAGMDHRFTVTELPAGYRSQLDPAQCREWAKVVA